MSKSSQRILPWLNRSEFLEGYRYLYSDNEASQLEGIKKVALWRCRAHHKLPVAIDCTSVLVDSTLHDAEVRRRGEFQTREHQVKLSYAMALIRLVNHITEKGQKKQYAQSVHMLAAEFGLPEWLVDMRHDATHGELPSLDLLREGVEWALDWLHQEYWQRQVSLDESPGREGEEPISGVIQGLLVNFMQIQFDYMHNNASLQEDCNVRQILSEMEHAFPKVKEHVVSYMASEGYLIVSPDQLNAMDIPASSAELLNSVDDLQLPDNIIIFWKPVLRMLHGLHVVPLLLDMLCEQLTVERDLANRFRAGWIFEIVNFIKLCRTNKKVPERSLFTKPFDIPCIPLAEKCLQKPGVYTPTLVKKLLEDTDDLGKATSETLSLLRIYAGQSEGEMKEPSLGFSYLSVKDLPQVTMQNEYFSHHHDEEVPWRLSNSGQSWHRSPIGLLPHQKLENLSFELKEHLFSQVQEDIDFTDVGAEHMSTSSHEVSILEKEMLSVDVSQVSGHIPTVQLL